jgi:hypothetical protein
MRTLQLLLLGSILAPSVSALGQHERHLDVGEVPVCISAEKRGQLVGERSKLFQQIEDYNVQADAFRAKCSQVRSGDTAMISYCQTEQTRLQGIQSGLAGDANHFSSEVNTAVQAYVEDLRQKVLNDEAAIKRLGFEKRAQDFADWDKLAEDAKEDFERETRDDLTDIAIDKAFSGLKRGATTIGSLNPPKANRLIRELQTAGVTDPYLIAAIRKLANASGKPAVAVGVNEFLEGVKTAVKVARKDENNGNLDAIANMLSAVETDPELSLLLNDIKFAAASVYNNAARRVSQNEILQLTALNEQQLKDLKRLSELLKNHVTQLNKAKQGNC